VSFKKDIDKLERVQRRATSLLPHIRQLHYQDRLKIMNLVYRRVRGDMIEVYKFFHDLYTVDRGILVMASSSITRGHNLKLSRLTCRSRIRHDYFSQEWTAKWCCKCFIGEQLQRSSGQALEGVYVLSGTTEKYCHFLLLTYWSAKRHLKTFLYQQAYIN